MLAALRWIGRILGWGILGAVGLLAIGLVAEEGGSSLAVWCTGIGVGAAGWGIWKNRRHLHRRVDIGAPIREGVARVGTIIRETRCTCAGCGNVWYYGKTDVTLQAANAMANTGKDMMCCTGLCLPALFIPDKKVIDLGKCPKCGSRAVTKETVEHTLP